jgi:hypothetical protein
MRNTRQFEELDNMHGARSICPGLWWAVALLLGCEMTHSMDATPDGNEATDPEAGAIAEAGATTNEDAEITEPDPCTRIPLFDGGVTAMDESCRYQWGWVAEPSPHGIIPDARNEPMLPITPDLVEAITSEGCTITCELGEAGPGRYACRDDAGVAIITAHIGAQSWTRDLRKGCPWSDEDSTSFWLTDVERCVPPDTVVLEGELVDYSGSGQVPHVYLEGEFVSFREFVGPTHGQPQPVGKPSIACSVTGNRYSCTSIGYRETVEHKVVVDGRATPVSLPVEDCVVEPVVLDIEVP